MIDLLGFLATFTTIIAIMVENKKLFRQLSVVACSLFIIYGWLIDSNPTIVVNVILLSIHIYKLIKE